MANPSLECACWTTASILTSSAGLGRKVNRDFLDRVWFWVLMLATAIMLGASLFADAPPEITLSVSPRVLVDFPGKRTDFWLHWRIERHPNNRYYSVAYTCLSGETRFSQSELDGDKAAMNYDWYPRIETGAGCNFEACIYRTKGKPYKCASVTVITLEDNEGR